MKKTHLLFALFAFLLFASEASSQQLSEYVKTNYSASIVAQVFDISTKVTLNEDNQRALAKLYHERDSAIYAMLRNGVNTGAIILYKNTMKDQIAGVLDEKQKYDLYVANKKFSAKDKFTYSQFSIALRYRDTLGLSSTQISSLYDEVDQLKQTKNDYYNIHKKSYDTRAYESEKSTALLTATQYDLLLRLKNESKAKASAENDWKELQDRGMETAYLEPTVKAELTEYYLVRNSIYNKYQHDPITQKAEAKEWYYNRPQALKALQKARRSPQNNTINQQYNVGN